MIKLILNPDKEGQAYTFEKKTILIGDKGSSQADLVLPGESLQDIHVKILEEDDRYVIVNTANDPFTALNGLPFGKKELKNNDLIQIGAQNLQCIFEETTVSSAEPPTAPVDELDSIDIEALVREVEQLEIQAEAPKEIEAPPPPPLEVVEPLSQKKYYLQEFDDETENWAPETENIEEPVPRKTILENWRMLVGLVLAVISIVTIFSAGWYFRASGINSQEEKKIAAGIADIAMAMTYAKLNHITPNKQNWADPIFLQNNLAQVLSPTLHTQAQVNYQGQFKNYPYILRVYNSSDMSRFLIIAQPAPNFFQWLIHKKSIVIDSTAMEMRKVADLKKLNRLLTSPSPLDGNTRNAISDLIKEGALMPLNSLSGNRNVWGFTPPPILSSFRPGAENYIYNGPRYYPFGESLLKNVIHLSRNGGNTEDLAKLKEDIEEISKFSDIVLYSSQGLQSALEAQKALATFAPDNKFLIAYLQFHTNGHVLGSHILAKAELSEISMLESSHNPYGPLLSEEEFSLEEELAENTLWEPTIDKNHPLYLQLQAATTQRIRTLKPLADEISGLLNRHNREIVPNFEETVLHLFQQYCVEDQSQREHLEDELASLYEEYSAMPLEDLLKYVEAAQLTSFVNEALAIQKEKISDFTALTDEMIEGQFERIGQSETLEELNEAVQETAEILSLSKSTNTSSLIVYQNAAHNKVLKKLTFFFLSPESLYAEGRFDSKDRARLTAILNASWVTEPHEYEYFLSEFDQLAEPGSSASF